MAAPVEVEIMGEKFSVTSEEGEEHVRRVARDVDRQMRQTIAALRTVSTYTAAVVTALNIASEYQKLKQQHAQIQEAIDRLTARLATRLAS